MATVETEVDVVVVGAGISGLTTAYHILKRCPTMTVVVLEAKDRVGGRTLTQELKTADGTDLWDLGGQWVGSSQTHIVDLVNELGLELCRQYTEGRKYMQLGGYRLRSYSSSLPSLSPLALVDLHRFITKIESMRKCVSMSNPYRCSQAELWDSKTLETFIQENLWTKAAKDAIAAAVRCILGVECCQISLLYYVTYCAGAGGIERLIETTEESAQDFLSRINEGGSQQISKELTKLIKEKNVLTNQPVFSVHQEEDGVRVRCGSGQRYRCQRLVISTPPHQTVRINFQPPLPIEKKEICQRMPVSLLIKVIITYPEAFWKNRGDCGELVTNGGPIRTKGCLKGPVCITYDCTSANGNPALVVFMGGSPAIEWSRVEALDRQKAVLNTLHQVWGQIVYDYLDYQEKDWSKEPYSEGSPVSCVAPGGMKYFSSGLRHPFHKQLERTGSLERKSDSGRSKTAWKKIFKNDCVFQQDSVPSHASRATQQHLEEVTPQFITKEEWPRQSPDCNPMGYSVWNSLSEKVYEGRTEKFTEDELKARIKDCWKKLLLRRMRAQSVHGRNVCPPSTEKIEDQLITFSSKTRIHFAGTESATAFCGYMNGAVQSGIRAATEVLHNLQPDLVTDDELDETFYGTKSHEPENAGDSPSLIGRAVKWSVRVGLVVSGVIIGHRLVSKT
ncbi:amine oxidase [flavin-containing] B-like [Liolophura sinensis]|uniref:amine oxidase [flavin-containing] B-like n=1 Tax=Liolophura sinensis TaxID=3198878 RepID=UPI0031581832